MISEWDKFTEYVKRIWIENHFQPVEDLKHTNSFNGTRKLMNIWYQHQKKIPDWNDMYQSDQKTKENIVSKCSEEKLVKYNMKL